MGKPYYCEYCDKSFKDELQARKKHLASVQHQKMRSEHYHKYRDLASVLQEELAKRPCLKYSTPQGCTFGTLCRFTHYTREELQQMEWKLRHKEDQTRLRARPKIVTADLESFMRSLDQKRATFEATSQIFWEYPDDLTRNMDLPPSMQKFDPTRLAGCSFPEWGD